MEAEMQGTGLEKTLIVTPEDRHEERQLETFCGNGGPLVAVVKKDSSYKFWHIEIRKEHS